MLTLKEWMEVVGYRITEGSDFQWGCFGHDAYCLDSWNGEQDGHSFTIIFDTKTQEVYEVQAHDYVNQRAYRLINSVYADQFRKEAENRSVLENQAWDDVEYIDLETDDDWIQKAIAIEAGEDYDTRVSVPVDFTDEELLKYMKLAHERDVTFNQLVEEALREAIEEHKRDPEGAKARAQRWLADRDQEAAAV
jgi:hypothetical protein